MYWAGTGQGTIKQRHVLQVNVECIVSGLDTTQIMVFGAFLSNVIIFTQVGSHIFPIFSV